MRILKTVALPGERTLHLCAGDILEEPVEAIVNAANSHLAHGGGVAAAISRAAGPEFDDESFVYVRDHGPVPTGSAIVTSAGRLPYKGVIHAVGPARGSGGEEATLASAVRAALDCAALRNWRSVAMPAISSGIFGVSLRICARAYIKGVQQHFTDHPDSPVREVRITLCLTFQGVTLRDLLQQQMEEVHPSTSEKQQRESDGQAS